jgi:hypothetical protein
MHGAKVLDVLAEKYPQAYLVALSKVIRWEVGEAGAFDRSLTPDEIMDRLEHVIHSGRPAASRSIHCRSYARQRMSGYFDFARTCIDRLNSFAPRTSQKSAIAKSIRPIFGAWSRRRARN